MEPLSLVCILLSCILPIVAVLLITINMTSRREVNDLNLPPGTRGFPFIGETIQFLKSHHSTNLGKFLEEKVQRHGKIFRTHLLGKPTVITVDREFNSFILRNDGILFAHDVSRLYRALLGAEVLELRDHRHLRTASHGFLGIPHVRSRLMEEYEQQTLDRLRSWQDGVVFPVREETAKVPFYLMMKTIFSMGAEEECTKNLFRLYQVLRRGVDSVPLNIPGTIYRKGLKARHAIIAIIRQLIEERSNSKYKDKSNITHGNSDYLSKLLETTNVDMEQIIWHIHGMIVAGHVTMTIALCSAIYFLGTCPKAITELQVEHDRIAHNKKLKGETKLAWEDVKQMRFTAHVVNEILRLGNVVWGLLRKTVGDVKFNGYVIPSGWNVFLTLAGTNLDGKVYNDPVRFDPWRWQDDDKRVEMMESYMPFSGGFYMCAGKELAKMQISVFIHHLVTMYEWELSEADHPQIIYGQCGFPKGLPIKVYSRG